MALKKPDPFMFDEDNGPLPDASGFRPSRERCAELGMPIPRGRPPVETPKRQVTLRLDEAVINHFKSGGKGWQTRLNDTLAAAIKAHPTRFAGLAAIAPQDPKAAAMELERGVRALGMKGAIVNSHTQGEYLDDPKFWDIFAAAEALDVPVYIHPNTPSNDMIKPFMARGLDGAVFGFAVETALHALRLVVSGVFDRFPKLHIVLGHLGEGLPYWLSRIDFMHGASVRSGRYASQPRLERKASDYLKENFYYTTSGMAWTPPIRYVQDVMGMDRLMYAMDYPYQFVPEEVNVTDALPLGYEDHKAFYQTNAERVFNL